MENQQDQKTNGTIIQEASSTTPGEDPVTKRSIRVQTWRKLQQTRSCVGYTQVFNKIPDFIGSKDAAALLAGTEEFKKATNIKVNVDRPQDAVRLEVITNGKNLYVIPLRESNALCTKVECPADVDERTKKRIIQRLRENRSDILLENKVQFDMVVVGSVIVSKDGYRIGRGNGFVDLDLAILAHTGAITPDTVIVTTVHDIQVADSLPKDLFQKYDFPVDMIVTPTQVIRVDKKLPRPQGIFWEILSERRCKILQVLQQIKENEEKEGKIIVLKSEDTDVETNARSQRPRQRRRMFYRYNRSRPRSQGRYENRENSRPRKRGNFRRRRITKSEGEQTGSGNENKGTNQNQHQNQNSNQNNQKHQQQQRRRRNKRDYCVRVTNIAKGVRVKDLKTELRKRNCNPIYITWKGGLGKCYLHFAKRKGSDKETDINTLIESLRDLKLTIQNGDETKVVDLSIELLQDQQQQQQQQSNQQNQKNEQQNQQNHDDKNEINQRIESVDTTSV